MTEEQLVNAAQPDPMAVVEEARRLGAALRPLAEKKGPLASEDSQAVAAAVRRLSGATLGAAIDDLKKNLLPALQQVTESHLRSFQMALASFLNARREAGDPWVETAGGWRIGFLELRIDKETGRIRFAYNEQHLGEWKSIASAAEIEKLRQEHVGLMQKSIIDEATLIEVFWDAYQVESGRLARENKPMPERVPVRNFYHQVRASLVWHELRKKPDATVRTTELPLWAFLYNLDRYLQLMPERIGEKRIGVEAAVMTEAGKALVVGGLHPDQHYRKIGKVIRP